MTQAGFIAITEILSGHADRLVTVLRIGESNDPFVSSRHLHFASFVLLPKIERIPERLVMETNYDGNLGEHLDELLRDGGDLLDRIYSNCKGYPLGSSHKEIKAYLVGHSVRPNAYYVA